MTSCPYGDDTTFMGRLEYPHEAPGKQKTPVWVMANLKVIILQGRRTFHSTQQIAVPPIVLTLAARLA